MDRALFLCYQDRLGDRFNLLFVGKPAFRVSHSHEDCHITVWVPIFGPILRKRLVASPSFEKERPFQCASFVTLAQFSQVTVDFSEAKEIIFGHGKEALFAKAVWCPVRWIRSG